MKRMKKTDKKRVFDKETIFRSAETEMNRSYTGCRQRIQTGIELTREGRLFCMMAGIVETVSVLTVFRIDLMYVPLLVFLVLWAAFGIVTSAFLVGTGYYYVSHRSVKTDLCAAVQQDSLILMQDQQIVWNMKKAS